MKNAELKVLLAGRLARIELKDHLQRSGIDCLRN
ncbi:hypothetical protein Anacy_0960 [Anabaena cylindrica PCC 7122]|uniref:Uncharacterized protein n=1 Tax=Anabaena cylindrica (strain ATCC 27899 / PCC 7122) TaxID=272123 RepID=K9ZDT2_ANACC|nr:hypothetical protein Anacy_0960 [Anabaena cylindrica PCC 7122]BAY01016.1 hypothetical protein NIES19_02460 [Anabaena cylindrica PCC 7122]